MFNLVSSTSFSEAKLPNKENQDSIIPVRKLDHGYLFAVADGVGSYLGAKQASYTVINELEKVNSITRDTVDLLFTRLKKSVSTISDDDSNLSQAATTLTFGYFCEDGLYIGHIGDCRLYIKNNNKLIQLTHDHTQHQKLLDEGIYTKQEISKLPGKNIITTAISKYIDMNYDGILIPFSEISTYKENNEIILYIMSDGAYHFWDKRKRFSERTMNDVNKFSISLKNRIQKDPIDDYSLVGVQFRLQEQEYKKPPALNS